ncbi:MAG: tetratricopeptide repeat protein [Archangium sp.]|nr:tetratricopeptide repeat protein [Archangium sp.]MDP3571510.1 tetratricopeptide repeat protein [Archangium sp.]
MDKNKIIEAAAKLVAKGAYDKAIKEYQKVLDADPKDVRILQKMGELFQKKNDNSQAAQYFTRVAESYTNDGFFLKAVALYKQVLKLDPSLMEVNIKLAELHQQLQLMGEAMAYFQIVATHWDKQGDTRRSLEVLRKMVDLDPDNVASRVKLADLYVREGLNAEAAGEFTKAAEHLKRNSRTDDYLRVAERLSSLQPDNLRLAKELAEAYLQKNDQKRALAKLQICFKADNRDIDTLRLLAVAFQGLGQMSKTISVFKELARAYEDKNMQGEAEQVWAQVGQLDPADPDVQARSAASAPAAPVYEAPPPSARSAPAGATAAMPAYAPAATAVQQTHQPAQTPAAKPKAPGADNLGKLLTETDVYVKYGLHDKALEHLRKVFAIDPENIDAHEKAYAIYVASNNHAQSFEQLLNVLRLHTRSGDAQRAQPYLASILQQQPGHPEVPVFLSALRMANGGATAANSQLQQESDAEDAILVDSSDDEVIVADEPEDVISGEMASEELVDSSEVLSDEVLLSASDAEAAGEVEVDPPPVPDLYEAEPDQQVISDFEAEAPISYDAASYDQPDGEPTTGEFSLVDEPAVYEDEPTGNVGLPVSTEPARQGIPMTTVPMSAPPGLGDDDEHDAPTRVQPRIDPSMLRSARPPLPEESFAEPEPEEDYEPPTTTTPIPEEVPVEAPPEDEPAIEECDEAMFFIEQSLYDEAREILETVLIAYPDHRRAAELMARVEAEQNGGASAPESTPSESTNGNEEEGRDAFDLAAELANELGDFGDEQADTGEASTGGGNDEYQVSVEEVFAEFKKGLEKVVKPEDVDTHYDLGVAYKEMGLIDDAVGEFTIARKGCLGKRKEIDCLSMIGMLQVARGEVTAAIDAYQQGLASDHAKGDVEKSLRYELAVAYEAAHQVGKALNQFLKVQAIDGNYREVAAAVERLSAITVPEDDMPPPPKGGSGPAGAPARAARKVGYV